MSNKTLFKQRGVQKRVPKEDARNEAGGGAYKFSDKHALAQYVVTGTFNNTYYVSAKEHLKNVEQLAANCDSQFLADLAVYGREVAKMKDTPAYLLAVLVARQEHALVRKIFHRVCNNSKMLLNFVQIIRSGAVGRRSFGTGPKRLIQEWIKGRSPKALYTSSIGHANPSLADVIRMARPRPQSVADQTMYTYLIGQDRQRDGEFVFDRDTLPEDLKILEDLRAGKTDKIPDINFQVLSGLDLSAKQWRQIGSNMPWNTLRMNLNQLARKGAFKGSTAFTKEVVDKLGDPDNVRKYNAFPYQLMTTFLNIDAEVPKKVALALQDAMEVATENVPSFPGKTAVCIDVSGSMGCAVTGGRRGSTSKTNCRQVASLFGACVLRQNEEAEVYAFDYAGYGGYSRAGKHQVVGGIYDPQLNPRDSVMTNANKLAQFGGGGTDCSLPMRWFNQEKKMYDNVIYVSDNQSWYGSYGSGQGFMSAWVEFIHRNLGAKLVNIDITPASTTQSPEKHKEILNVGGFSDSIWLIVEQFLSRDMDATFIDVIENYGVDSQS
ncbi:MAG: vWA domain-containing protein [Candidatus Thorarchaeota archaeon]|jgi:60 kDa SS-A/Ro ribonucleoprotein